MSSTAALLNTILASNNGVTLTELLGSHPAVARRTAQRLIAKLVANGQIIAVGEGRARRYVGPEAYVAAADASSLLDRAAGFAAIPLSADSQDILAYIEQPCDCLLIRS